MNTMNQTPTSQADIKAPPKQARAKTAPPIPNERIVHQVQRNPFLDWLIILVVSVTIAVILVWVGVSVYLDTGTRLDINPTGSPTGYKFPFSESTFQKVLTDFDDKAAERAAFMRSYAAPRDPSLP